MDTDAVPGKSWGFPVAVYLILAAVGISLILYKTAGCTVPYLPAACVFAWCCFLASVVGQTALYHMYFLEEPRWAARVRLGLWVFGTIGSITPVWPLVAVLAAANT